VNGPDTQPADCLMTVAEVAGLAHLSIREIRYLVSIGEIESVRPPGRRTSYISRRAFRAWLRARAPKQPE